jgi:beta-N-acetylhexosaminidase
MDRPYGQAAASATRPADATAPIRRPVLAVDQDAPMIGRRRRALPVALLCAVLAACTSTSGHPAASPTTPIEESTPPSTTPAATPASRSPVADPNARVAAALSRLDRRAQVGQLFLVGVPLADLAAGASVVRSGVGGVFLAGRSTRSVADLASVTAGWQALTSGPRLWVAADQEGGLVQTLKGPGFALLPTAQTQGMLSPAALARLATGMGRSLHQAGLNLDLAPVTDVVPAGTEALNQPIGQYHRQYGSTPAAVGAAAGTVRDGLAREGVTAALKHYPGLGRVRGNTDTQPVTDTVTAAGDADVGLFGTLARSSAHPFVMVSSAVYARIDPANPAAFSPTVLQTLLRGRLGFSGVIVSDDLGQAGAVAAISPADRAVRFFAAGGTLLLTVRAAVVPQMVDAVLARSAADPAFAREVDAAVRTALMAKDRAGLLPPA